MMTKRNGYQWKDFMGSIRLTSLAISLMRWSIWLGVVPSLNFAKNMCFTTPFASSMLSSFFLRIVKFEYVFYFLFSLLPQPLFGH
jgi:hypothetical protein